MLVILAHERRRVVHVAVTDHPTSAWTAQQLRNAFPNEERPSYLLHDRDGAFAGIAGTITAMQIHNVMTAARSPFYMRSRTHLSLDKDSPTPRPVMPPTASRSHLKSVFLNVGSSFR